MDSLAVGSDSRSVHGFLDPTHDESRNIILAVNIMILNGVLKGLVIENRCFSQVTMYWQIFLSFFPFLTSRKYSNF